MVRAALDAVSFGRGFSTFGASGGRAATCGDAGCGDSVVGDGDGVGGSDNDGTAPSTGAVGSRRVERADIIARRLRGMIARSA
jgi:hypothetical protein